MKNYHFQIDLRGIIELLSNHLYSGPQVYVRELMQNGIDAISARRRNDHSYQGNIEIQVGSLEAGTVTFTDNGVGLTEEEIHRFLATIGESSKRRLSGKEETSDFIGQFGIGLLSCFVVSDEIIVTTQSIHPQAQAVRWCGRSDGIYSIQMIDEPLAPGTQVTLQCKKGYEEFFQEERVVELARYYGSLLPYPVVVSGSSGQVCINSEQIPWRMDISQAEKQALLLKYGQEVFGIEFLDAIPLHSTAGKLDGVAYVLPYSLNVIARSTHRVFLKNMLLSEEATSLLPEWAFFVKCVINANDLRPTASRESFYEDKILSQARDNLGACLREYLVKLAQQEPSRLRTLISIHHLAIKSIALYDDELFRLFIDLLPFETSFGVMTLNEYLKKNVTLRYVKDFDEFRQIRSVAVAQGQCILNAGYTYDLELIEKIPYLLPGLHIEKVDVTTFTRSFEELSQEEREHTHLLCNLAEEALQPFQCAVEIRKFQPQELPVLYTTTEQGNLVRSMNKTKEISHGPWAKVIGSLASSVHHSRTQLCLNFQNEIVWQLSQTTDTKLVKLCIKMLYIQALLLGHHPLSTLEMQALNECLMGFVLWGVGHPKIGNILN